MEKCRYCGKEFSSSVVKFHEKRCFENPKNKKEPQEPKNPLEDFTVPELREVAKEKSIEGYSNMKKAELIKALSKEE